MAKSIWKGDISFGLVSIPVTLVSVLEKHDLAFHLLDSRDHSRIRYQRVNEETGKEVAWDKIVKGYEFDKNNYIIVEEEAFEKASPEIYKSIDIEEFVNLQDIDPLFFEKPYYLIPDSKNNKAYVLLREALKKTGKVGVAKVILRSKEYLSLVLPHQNALLLYLLHFKEDIREEADIRVPKEPLNAYRFAAREIKMASDLISEMTNPWQPEKYHNDYQETLKKWLDKKTAAALKTENKVSKRVTSQKTPDVGDFIALLKQSMKKNKQNQGKKREGKS